MDNRLKYIKDNEKKIREDLKFVIEGTLKLVSEIQKKQKADMKSLLDQVKREHAKNNKV